jgi:hypothetical protein
LRFRGAASAFELALAGVYLLPRMSSCDSLTVAASSILDVPDYTTFGETVNAFL